MLVQKTSREVPYFRKGSRLIGKNSSLQDANSGCSNRIGCSTRLCSTALESDNIAKSKNLTTHFSMGHKVNSQQPFRLISVSIYHQKPLPAQFNQSLPQKRTIAKRINGKVKIDFTKCTGRQVETEDAQSTPRIARIHELSSCLKDGNSASLQNLSEDGTGGLKTCSATLSQGTRKHNRRRPDCGSYYAPTISSTQRLIASRDAKKAIKICSQGAGPGAKKCNLKNNSCSSISKVILSGCSHSISVPSRTDTRTSKMYLAGESSASRSKSMPASLNRNLSGSANTRLPKSTTPKASRMTNKSKIIDHLVVAKPQEPSKIETTRGLTTKGNPHLPCEAMVVQVPVTTFYSLKAPGSSSRSLDNELSSACQNVSGMKDFTRRTAPYKPTSSPKQGSLPTSCDPSANADAQSRNNTEGISEASMLLERIEHTQERTYEHMPESESNLFPGSLNYHDQHREMRMDIDNMSYEELLELEEKMGSVCTGLTDAALTKCLKRSYFMVAPSPSEITDCVEDGNRCSICQGECADGDNIGTLACEHWYHVVCIQQWLRLKNWCPVCKAPACANSQLMAS